MTPVAFTRASQLKPFVNALTRSDIPVDDALSRVHLSTDLLRHPDSVFPEVLLWKLVAHAETRHARTDFGFLAGEASHLEQLGAFGIRVCSSANLAEAIQRFIVDASLHQNSPPFWCEDDLDAVWLCRLGPANMPCGHWQIEQYVLSMMIQLVQLAAEPHWTPPVAHLQCQQVTSVEHANCLQHTRIFTGRQRTAIKIQKDLLNNPLKILATINPTGEPPPRSQIGYSLADNLALMLAPLIEKERVSIVSVADRLAISRRSLQRQLERERTSFSTVYERTLERRAIEKIRQPHASITRVGSELGYSDTAHFSRAFKRWTGQSPQAYRRAMLPTPDLADRSA